MRRPFATLLALLLAGPAAAGPFTPLPPGSPGPGGYRATCDLPPSQHHKNTGGTDGAGLCVPTSLWHDAIWQNLHELDGYRAYCETLPGGGWPSKVDQTLADYCRQRGIPVPAYVQHTRGDEQFLDLAMRTGRAVGITYNGRDDFYRSTIAHMVTLVHLDQQWAAILDNNRPGVLVWMTRDDLLARWRGGRGGGWAVLFLASPPPPYPHGSGPTPAPAPLKPLTPGPLPRPCPGPGPCPVNYRWEYVRFANGHDGYKLIGDGGFWGFYDYAGWHPAVPGGGWTSAAAGAEPPVPPPGAPAEVNFGVDRDQVAREHRGYILNGAEVSREVAFAAVGDVLTDDSGRWNLTLVGDGAKAAADVKALPAATKERLHVQSYQGGAWEVGQFGLRPGVTLRKPAVGRVGAEVETIQPDAYTREKLADLLLELDGKRPPKSPPKPPERPKQPDPPAVPTADQGSNPAMLFVSSLLATLLTLTRKKVTP